MRAGSAEAKELSAEFLRHVKEACNPGMFDDAEKPLPKTEKSTQQPAEEPPARHYRRPTQSSNPEPEWRVAHSGKGITIKVATEKDQDKEAKSRRQSNDDTPKSVTVTGRKSDSPKEQEQRTKTSNKGYIAPIPVPVPKSPSTSKSTGPKQEGLKDGRRRKRKGSSQGDDDTDIATPVKSADGGTEAGEFGAGRRKARSGANTYIAEQIADREYAHALSVETPSKPTVNRMQQLKDTAVNGLGQVLGSAAHYFAPARGNGAGRPLVRLRRPGRF